MFGKTMLSAFAVAALAGAQMLPEGTAVTLRLEESVSSGTAQKGQAIEFTVMEDIIVDDVTVIKQGSRAMGIVIEAESKKRMGRAGKLDFTVEKVRAADGRYVNLRPTQSNYSGRGNSLKAGLMTAGIALVFWPAAPVALLMKGKDVTVPRGTRFTAFTDNSYALSTVQPRNYNEAKMQPAVEAPAPVAPVVQAVAVTTAAGTAVLTIDSSPAGAEIMLDGKFAGNTPTSLSVPAGTHTVMVWDARGKWEREIPVTAGSKISLNAQLTPQTLTAASR